MYIVTHIVDHRVSPSIHKAIAFLGGIIEEVSGTITKGTIGSLTCRDVTLAASEPVLRSRDSVENPR